MAKRNRRAKAKLPRPVNPSVDEQKHIKKAGRGLIEVRNLMQATETIARILGSMAEHVQNHRQIRIFWTKQEMPHVTPDFRICLPVPAEVTDEIVARLMMFRDHEVSHVLYSDFGLVQKALDHDRGAGKNMTAKNLLNALEDIRIEAAFGKIFAGSAANFVKFYNRNQAELHRSLLSRQSFADQVGVACILWANGVPLPSETPDITLRGLEVAKPFIKQVQGLCDQREDVKVTYQKSKQLFDIAMRLYDALKRFAQDNADQFKSMSSGDMGMGEEGEEESEGDDADQKSKKSKSKPKKDDKSKSKSKKSKASKGDEDDDEGDEDDGSGSSGDGDESEGDESEGDESEGDESGSAGDSDESEEGEGAGEGDDSEEGEGAGEGDDSDADAGVDGEEGDDADEGDAGDSGVNSGGSNSGDADGDDAKDGDADGDGADGDGDGDQPDSGPRDHDDGYEGHGTSNPYDPTFVFSEEDLSEAINSLRADDAKMEVDEEVFEELAQHQAGGWGRKTQTDPVTGEEMIPNEVISQIAKATEGHIQEQHAHRGHRQLDGMDEFGRNVGMQSANLARLLMGLDRKWTHRRRLDGRVDDRMLAEAALGTTDRCFKNVHRTKADSVVVSLLVDLSGSMGWDGGEAHGKLYEAKRACFALAAVCERARVKFEIAGYSDAGGGPALWIAKSFGQPWGDETKARVAGFGTHGGTPTGECSLIAGRRLGQMRADRHILFVVTDGDPNDQQYNRDAVDILRRGGIEVYGFGISGAREAGLADQYGNGGYVFCPSTAKGLEHELVALLSRLLMPAMAKVMARR